jgi:CheY-like chemotaxis protein
VALKPKIRHVLLVEDNEADILLTREALASCEREIVVHDVRDGEQAMNFLYRNPPFSEAPTPDLILLDLNLPRKSGLEVLTEVRDSQELPCIPILVLSSSEAEQDVVKSYKLRANCFISKPIDLTRFVEIVQQIDQFWFSTVQLPRSLR